MPVPVGLFTAMVPVATLQVGCMILTIGVAGVAGCGLMVTEKEADTQLLFLAVTL